MIGLGQIGHEVGQIGHEVEFAVVGMESTVRTATRKAMNKMRPTHATGAPSSVSANGAAASDFVFQRGECQILSSLLSAREGITPTERALPGGGGGGDDGGDEQLHGR